MIRSISTIPITARIDLFTFDISIYVLYSNLNLNKSTLLIITENGETLSLKIKELKQNEKNNNIISVVKKISLTYNSFLKNYTQSAEKLKSLVAVSPGSALL